MKHKKKAADEKHRKCKIMVENVIKIQYNTTENSYCELTERKRKNQVLTEESIAMEIAFYEDLYRRQSKLLKAMPSGNIYF